MSTFYYIGHEQFVIQDNSILKVYVLDFKNKIVHTIYKAFNKDIASKLDNYKPFDNITSSIGFVIKRDGKISLDIK